MTQTEQQELEMEIMEGIIIPLGKLGFIPVMMYNKTRQIPRITISGSTKPKTTSTLTTIIFDNIPVEEGLSDHELFPQIEEVLTDVNFRDAMGEASMFKAACLIDNGLLYVLITKTL